MKGIEQRHSTKDTARDVARDVASSAAPGNGSEATTHREATIDQVRDLLFGGAQRSIEGNLAGLREEMQASLSRLQADFAKELAALQAKVTELERDTEQKRLASHRDIGAAISELGATISGLGSGHAGR
ncbi:hypothetical protein [Bradyrhizobium prioriisuperbiae]|uniref:hypothetical protein n=1 Tax=Bradyrhizobium prioriisuperbiae TaxID=2854389 RepID=UPI0028F15EE9|nr:hypothetical protein [Bradyrhizobium prioritasuperba]